MKLEDILGLGATAPSDQKEIRTTITIPEEVMNYYKKKEKDLNTKLSKILKSLLVKIEERQIGLENNSTANINFIDNTILITKNREDSKPDVKLKSMAMAFRATEDCYNYISKLKNLDINLATHLSNLLILLMDGELKSETIQVKKTEIVITKEETLFEEEELNKVSEEIDKTIKKEKEIKKPKQDMFADFGAF